MKLVKTTEIEITIDDVVAVLTHSDDQAAFFNVMAEHFKSFAEGDRDGFQMFFIKQDLTDDGKAFIKKLYEYTCLEPDV